MRCAAVPPPLAVSTMGCHYVVTAVNACESYREFNRLLYQRQQSPPAACGQETRAAPGSTFDWCPPKLCSSRRGGPSAEVFRISYLLPTDWSRLLRLCRSLTYPDGAFNFTSPGDLSSVKAGGAELSYTTETTEWSREGSTDFAHALNHAFLHIVERVRGDFTPNNMVYHELQKYRLIDGGEGGAPSRAIDAETSGKYLEFSRLIHRLQQQSCLCASEAGAAVGVSSKALESAAVKQTKDALFNNTAAALYSSENQLLPQRLPSALRTAASSSLPSEGPCCEADKDALRFVFFPHQIDALSCIPYCSAHFCVMVNLKPIVPFHLMVVPLRCVSSIHGLTEDEVEDWGRVMQLTLQVLTEVCLDGGAAANPLPLTGQYSNTATMTDDENGHDAGGFSGGEANNFSISIQQGTCAGQTVDHLHTHVIPFNPTSKLAGEPETDEAEQRRRPPRTTALMEKETRQLRHIFDKYTRRLINAGTSVSAAL